MCDEYETTDIIEGKTKIGTIEKPCNEKPATGGIRACLKYKFHAAGSSRKKKELPAWAKSDK